MNKHIKKVQIEYVNGKYIYFFSITSIIPYSIFLSDRSCVYNATVASDDNFIITHNMKWLIYNYFNQELSFQPKEIQT